MKQMTYVSLRLGRWFDHFCAAWEKLPWLCWRRRRWRGAHFDVPSGAWGTTCRRRLLSLTLTACRFDSGLLDTGHAAVRMGRSISFMGPSDIYICPRISAVTFRSNPIDPIWPDLWYGGIWKNIRYDQYIYIIDLRQNIWMWPDREVNRHLINGPILDGNT